MQLKPQKIGHKLLKFCLGVSGKGRGGPNCPLEPFFDDKNLQKRAKIQNQAYVHRLYDLCTRNRKSYLMIDSSAVEHWAHNLRVQGSSLTVSKLLKWTKFGPL